MTSDDEDYIDPYDQKISADSVSEGAEVEVKASSSSSGKLSDKKLKKSKKSSSSSYSSGAKESIRSSPSPSVETTSLHQPIIAETKTFKDTEQCPTDMSGDSTDSEGDKKMDFVNDAECNSMHEGRQLVHTILPINIETVFGLLFHKSKFFTDFHKNRKTTDLEQGEWQDMPDDTKQRVISLTVAITQVVGPKSSHVTETQVMRSCSKPGKLYSIDATSVNTGKLINMKSLDNYFKSFSTFLGIPYADSFYVFCHYCMKSTVDDSTVMSVHAQIKYKKSVWGVIKGFIEKNTWYGLEDFYEALSKALMSEYCLPPAKGKGRRPRKGSSMPLQLTSTSQPALPTKHLEIDDAMHVTTPTSGHKVRQMTRMSEMESSNQNNKQVKMSWIVIILLVALIAFNVILYVKLWKIDGYQHEEDLLHNKLEFLR